MSVSSYPYEFAIRAAAVLGSDLEASVTLEEHGLTVLAGSSTDAAARCDQAEALAESGPCIDAMELLENRVVPWIAAESRWVVWRDQALAEGFVSAFAVPAVVSEHAAVALNLYSRVPDPWSPGLIVAAGAYAHLAASSVRLHLDLADLEDAAAGIFRRMSDAVVAERAVGAIMQANGCTQSVAREVLASASAHHGVSEREVAELVVRALVVTQGPTAPLEFF